MAGAKRQLKWTERALRDIDAIGAWRAKNHSKTTAENVLSVIRKSAEGLLMFPKRGKVAELSPRNRHLVIKGYPYTIVYRFDEAAGIVWIRQIWQHPQNYTRA